jgi:hypothetical protein
MQDNQTLRGLWNIDRSPHHTARSVYQGYVEGRQQSRETISAAGTASTTSELPTVPTSISATAVSTATTLSTTTEDDIQAKQSHDDVGHIRLTSNATTGATTSNDVRNATNANANTSNANAYTTAATD